MAEKAKVSEEEEEADVISTLPVEIRSHIISFLPLEEAVQTCVLSRSWSKIFTSLTNLKFHDYSSKFMNFVDRFLSSRTGVVDRLSISFDASHVDFDRISGWITYALSNKLKELDICIRHDSQIKLPFEILFTSNTLEVLRLSIDFHFVLKLPNDVRLPSLKCLHLRDVIISGDDSIQRLVSSSPVLEELVVTKSHLTNGFKLDVFNTTLKRLTISSSTEGFNCEKKVRVFLTGMVDKEICLPTLNYLHLSEIQIYNGDSDSIQTLISRCSALEELVLENWYFKQSHEANVFNPSSFGVFNTTLKRLTISRLRGIGKDFEFRIDAPCLVYFNLCCDVPQRFLLKNLNSLVQVGIEFIAYRSCPDHFYHQPYAIDLFEGITCVQSLHLSGMFAKVWLQGDNIKIPELPNLTYLTLDSFLGWEGILPILLSCFPHLEALDFKVYRNHLIDINKVTLPSSLWTLLKRLEILSFKGEDNELQIVEYFLKNAKVLEKLTIQIDTRLRPATIEWKSSITETVLKLPKISENCMILVV